MGSMRKTVKAPTGKAPVSQLGKAMKCLYCEGTGKIYTGMEPWKGSETGFRWATTPCRNCGGKGVKE